ncbi:putative DNA endonuclease [Pseudomonas phage MR16]|nr:putative DNA endonuclease [Pseudomonas phage MR8]QJD55025.1 putative DNA endonuclease [Pseudomonas phage MR12]QJD55328.1 putative DNA endonuclease [Pseudomonas phage MR18]QJF74592.1 putative DNA endonuclease [Pseudomonas phage MR16]
MEWSVLFEDLGWHLRWRRTGRLAGLSPNSEGYRQVEVAGRKYKVHRVLWEMRNSVIPVGYEVDHRDGNKLNNLPDNLRLATRNQNQHNHRVRRDNTSGSTGVSKHRDVWKVRVMVDGQSHYGGVFSTQESAEAAANQLRRQLHGEFAGERDE